MDKLNKACVKWYNIGMMLPVEIGRLDSIKERCDEMLLFRGVPFPIIAGPQVSAVPLLNSSACGRGCGCGRGYGHGSHSHSQDKRPGRLPEVSLSWISMILYLQFAGCLSIVYYVVSQVNVNNHPECLM